MKLRVCLFGFVWSILIAFSPTASAKSGGIAALVKNAVPQLNQQIAKIAENGRVVVRAACVAAAACIFAFTAPDVKADLDNLDFSSESFKTEGKSGVFSSSGIEKGEGVPYISEWWFSQGMYLDNSGKLITSRLGFIGERGNLSGYITTAFRTHPDMLDGVNNLGSKVRLYAGFRNLAIGDSEGLGYIYMNNHAFVSGDRTILRSLQNFLLSYGTTVDVGVGDAKKLDINLALLGHEYNDPNALEELENDDGLRTQGMSLARAGFRLADVIDTDVIDVGVKLNASLGVGDLGFVKLGEVYQADLDNWAGKGTNLNHRWLTRVGGSIGFAVGEHLELSGGLDFTNAIGGKIDGLEGGEFDVSRRIVSVGVNADVIPAHNVTLELLTEWYKQNTNGSAPSLGEYSSVDRGIWIRATGGIGF